MPGVGSGVLSGQVSQRKAVALAHGSLGCPSFCVAHPRRESPQPGAPLSPALKYDANAGLSLLTPLGRDKEKSKCFMLSILSGAVMSCRRKC